jgi:hypothetical protein
MSTTTNTRTSNRIAAGVTAAYLRDLSPGRARRPHRGGARAVAAAPRRSRPPAPGDRAMTSRVRPGPMNDV